MKTASVLSTTIVSSALLFGCSPSTQVPNQEATGILEFDFRGRFTDAVSLQLSACPNPKQSYTQALNLNVAGIKKLQLKEGIYCFPKITLQDGTSRKWTNQMLAVYRAKSVTLHVNDESISAENTPTLREKMRRQGEGLLHCLRKGC
jgi:hypothetical protein